MCIVSLCESVRQCVCDTWGLRASRGACAGDCNPGEHWSLSVTRSARVLGTGAPTVNICKSACALPSAGEWAMRLITFSGPPRVNQQHLIVPTLVEGFCSSNVCNRCF